MAEITKIQSSKNKRDVVVDSDNRLREVEILSPPDIQSNQIIFREFLTLNGEGATSDMRSDGSVNPVDFYIQSEQQYDIYINSILFTISAENTTMDLQEFANLPALTNGCQIIYETTLNGQNIISNNIRTNLDLLRTCNFKPNLGASTGGDEFKIFNAIQGTTSPETILAILNFADIGYEPEYRGGIRLTNGSGDKLIVRINDDITGISTTEILGFDAIAYGNKIKI